jgi:transcriptional regulator with XRE-family HTH domain
MSREALVGRFGETLRRLRLERGHSQERFAELCGLHCTYIGSIEGGEKVVTIVTADKLARALGLSLTELFAELEGEAPDADGG